MSGPGLRFKLEVQFFLGESQLRSVLYSAAACELQTILP